MRLFETTLKRIAAALCLALLVCCRRWAVRSLLIRGFTG